MPGIDSYVNPNFIRYDEGHTLTRTTNDRYMKFDNRRHYRTGEGYMLQTGYNSQNPSTTVGNVQTNTDAIKMQPFISAVYATASG